ncbi:MAG: sigma-54-dependent Fis family transcriptional regulator [Myxococcales bacterium]|nr:sigma-54-dependent Fis family transcriptional regulator [Myxococcales bacterium]
MDTLFVVDDEILITEVLDRLLADAGYAVHVYHQAEPALAEIKEKNPFLVLLDLQLPGMNGLEALQLIRRRNRGTEVMMISGYGTIEMAVEAMKLGACDFLSKPLQLPEVLSRVGRIHETFLLRNKVDELRSRQKEEFFATLYQSRHPSFAAIDRTVRQITQFPNIVALITGDSGTGKEMLARQIHYQSPHAEGAFVPVNCAAIPENLLESELFGYEPGSFTGALAKGKAGLIERADGGTLFLDEIGDLPAAAQVKLLRFLQDRIVTRIGGSEGRKMDCSIIAATHRDPEKMMKEGTFREDLYYRINVIRLHLPPLRDRPDDILAYADSFLTQYNQHMGRRFQGFDQYARQKLLTYAWPGNLRELRNAIERACLLATGSWITAIDLVTNAQETIGRPEAGLEKPMPLDLATNIYVRRVLESVSGNKSEAAKLLDISRNRLKRLLSSN